MPHDARLRDKVRTYYGTVGQYIEQELRRRKDREFWDALADGRAEEPAEDPTDDTHDPPAVLDLGCGTGRITGILASRGRTVVGIDLSRVMLQKARKRLKKRPRVALVQADMRSFRARRHFGLIVAANDPFTHLVEDDDRDRAIRTVAHHLGRPGGRFILDGFWLGDERMREAAGPKGFQRERSVPRNGAGGESRSGDGALVIRESWRCDPASRRCQVRFEYLRNGEEEDRASFTSRLWSLDEVHERLDRVGLAVRELWGGFDRRPFDPDSATHMIVEAGWPKRDRGRVDHGSMIDRR